MTISRDIAPREQLETRSRESRVTESEIEDVLMRNGGCSCEEIADLLYKEFPAVEKVLRQMEISGKIVPKMVRTGHRWRDRECLYYLPKPKEVSPQPKKKPQPQPKKPRRASKKASTDRVKYRPPFRDWEGNEYSSRKEVKEKLGISRSTLMRWFREGRLGYSGNPATRKIKNHHNPPFTDSKGNQFESIQAVADFYGIKRGSVANWLRRGILGSCGNPPTKKPCKPRHQPPFTTRNGTVYHSGEQVREALQLSRKQFNNALAHGAIGSNGEKPTSRSRSRRVTNGKKTWESVLQASQELGQNREQIQYRLKNKKDGWRYVNEH